METKREENLAPENGTLDKKAETALDLPTSVGEPGTQTADLAPTGGANGSAASGGAAYLPAATVPESGSSGATPKIIRGNESTSRRARVRGMADEVTQLLGPAPWLSRSA